MRDHRCHDSHNGIYNKESVTTAAVPVARAIPRSHDRDSCGTHSGDQRSRGGHTKGNAMPCHAMPCHAMLCHEVMITTAVTSTVAVTAAAAATVRRWQG